MREHFFANSRQQWCASWVACARTCLAVQRDPSRSHSTDARSLLLPGWHVPLQAPCECRHRQRHQRDSPLPSLPPRQRAVRVSRMHALACAITLQACISRRRAHHAHTWHAAPSSVPSFPPPPRMSPNFEQESPNFVVGWDTIPLWSVDALLDMYGLQYVDVLKIDTEGGRAAIGAAAVPRRRRHGPPVPACLPARCAFPATCTPRASAAPPPPPACLQATTCRR